MKFVPKKKYVVKAFSENGLVTPRESMNPYSNIFDGYGYDTEEEAIEAIVKKGTSGYVIVTQINLVPDWDKE